MPRPSSLSFDTLRLEGGLFVPDLLEKAARGELAHQKESDYQLPKGLKLYDEAGRAFQIAQAQWAAFARQLDRQDLDPTPAFVHELLRDAFGYSAFSSAFPVPSSAFPLLTAPHSLSLDTPHERFATPGGSARKKSPFQALQEFLNASPDHTWGLVTNGRQIRLLRDSANLTRPSYLEIDLETILAGARYPDFAAAWRLLHASRAGDATRPCVWEAWRKEGLTQGTRVRDGLRHGVAQALLALGNGFLRPDANHALRQRLHDGDLTREAYFQQLLRLVYRLLFLFTAEERDVLHGDDADHAARDLYAQGYSLARLRDRCLRASGADPHGDLWQALRIVFIALAEGRPRLALPALGGLFAPGQCPDLDAATLANADLLAALRHLRWFASGNAFSPVDYRNLGPEELGSVYESLLELVPEIELPARRFAFIGLDAGPAAKGNARKTTGSHYTPDSLVQELVRSALDPVIAARLAAHPADPVEALLSLTVIDPACGSGHFLLAAARRLAERLAQLRAPEGVVRPQDYRHALRDVTARCLYGVDRNPMALELARVALWLEGYEPGRALGFLDHHLVCGDALLGLLRLDALRQGIPDDAFKPLSGDTKVDCRALAKENRAGRKSLSDFAKTVEDPEHHIHEKKQQRELFGLEAPKPLKQAAFSWEVGQSPAAFDRVEALPGDTVEQNAAKASAWEALYRESRTGPAGRAADLFLAAFLLPKADEAAATTVPTSQTLFAEANPDYRKPDHETRVAAAQAACRQARVLHWPLAFPHVFARGGFDCVLANPPWERIKLQEEEFFATRHLAVAEARNKAERAQRIAWLADGLLAHHLTNAPSAQARPDPLEIALYREFLTARRVAEAASVFAHVDGAEGGRFPLTGVGDVNTYALFAESITQLTAPAGRAGFIVPTGIATDDSTKAFFAFVSQTGRLTHFYSFENEELLFDSVHHAFRFSLMTVAGGPRGEPAQFVHFARQVEYLQNPDRRFTLTPEDFRLINPNTRTCPVFRSRKDAELTRQIYARVPVLLREERDGEPEQNPWGIRFSAMFHMSGDSGLFEARDGGEHLPLCEAKMIHQFDHRWASYGSSVAGEEESDLVPLADKQNPDFRVRPRYWVHRREVWRRTSRLPPGLRDAICDGHLELVRLFVAHMLFGSWLRNHGITRADAALRDLYPCWKRFIADQPFAAPVVPTSLGLCGENPSFLDSEGSEFLPAVAVADIVDNGREKTAWIPADPEAVRLYLEAAQTQPKYARSTDPLRTDEELLAHAQSMLQKSLPKHVMGFRDICRATDERTLIASVLPLSAVNHKFPLFACHGVGGAATQARLLANLDSLVVDFVARQKIGGTSMAYFYLKQLPVLPPSAYGPVESAFLIPRVLELTHTAHDLRGWAEAVWAEADEPLRAAIRAAWAANQSAAGRPASDYALQPFAYLPDRRAVLRAELDALYARLYGLTRDDLRYILDPADPLGPDYPSETFRVLKNNDLRNHGEYRTQRLVLEAWDRQMAMNPEGSQPLAGG